jgi:hypothetical protein
MNPPISSLWELRTEYPDAKVSHYPPSADTHPTAAQLWAGLEDLKFESSSATRGDQAFLVAFKRGAFSSSTETPLTKSVFVDSADPLSLRGGGRGGGGPAVPETSASSAILLGAVGTLLLLKFFRR